MLRILALLGGLTGALGLSQYPEFAQQYYQRLSGAVDELRVVAVGFDTAARAAGLSRQEALAQLDGSEFRSSLRGSLSTNLARYEKLNANYEVLSRRSPIKRLAEPWRYMDPELRRRTWEEFKPALPVTFEGLMSAAAGYFAGWALVAGLFAWLGWVFRGPRRRRMN